MKDIGLKSLFWSGLLLRLALIVCIEPVYAAVYYAPFMETTSLTLTPWNAWLQTGGSIEAFPYGYAMWMVFLPLTLVFTLFDLPVIYGYLATLLIVDLCLLKALRINMMDWSKLVLAAYWCSPVVILATYAMGLNDIIPAFLLLASVNLLKANRVTWAGFVLASAASAKISMLIAVPLVLIYLQNNNLLRPKILPFVTSLSIASATFFLPFFASEDATTMLLGNPELTKVLSLAIEVGAGLQVYVVPLGYLLLLYATWHTKRLNYDLLIATLALAFLFMVLTTTGSPAWFIWALPFLVLYQSRGNLTTAVIVMVFTLLFATELILKAPPSNSANMINYLIHNLIFTAAMSEYMEVSVIHSTVRTSLVAIGVILGFRVWRDAIMENNFFKISRSPFLIGVAGDSGSGKDTFSDSLVDLFGAHSAGCVHGDDYHLWDRSRPVWQAVTHLNPLSNDIDRLTQDILTLKRGHSIRSRHYNHTTGMISTPRTVKSNDLIVVSGLHSLSSTILRESYNLSIYLDMDERLREHLKIKRDMQQRGYSRDQVVMAIDRRKIDAKKFIKPQKQHADLILSIRAIDENFNTETHTDDTPRLALEIKTRSSDKMTALHRALVGLCGLQVDVDIDSVNGQVQMWIEGEVLSEDIAEVVEMTCPDVTEFLDRPTTYHNGVLGLMQLVTLCHIDTAMRLKSFT